MSYVHTHTHTHTHTRKRKFFKTINWLFVSVILVALLWSCQKDHETSVTSKTLTPQSSTSKTVSASEIPKVMQFLESKSNNRLEFVIDASNFELGMHRNHEENLSITTALTDQIKMVTNSYGKSNYTFKLIEEQTKEGTYFLNLVVKEYKDGFYMYIIKYVPDAGWLQSSSLSRNFNEFTGDIYFYSDTGLYLSKIELISGVPTSTDFRHPCDEDGTTTTTGNSSGSGTTSGVDNSSGSSSITSGSSSTGAGGGATVISPCSFEIMVINCGAPLNDHIPHSFHECDGPDGPNHNGDDTYTIVIMIDCQDDDINKTMNDHLRHPCDPDPCERCPNDDFIENNTIGVNLDIYEILYQNFFNGLNFEQQQFLENNGFLKLEIQTFLVGNGFSGEAEVVNWIDFVMSNTDVNVKEFTLSLHTDLTETPWVPNPGFFNGISSLEYSHTRAVVINGVTLTQYYLLNGDVISTGEYGIWQDSDFKVYYFSQQKKKWFEIPNPSNYDPLTLNFMWDGFWDGVLVGVRYFTPIEDVVILIEGVDFEGVEQSRAVAAAFILVDIIPGTQLVKAIKLVKYGDEIVHGAELVIKYVDDAYRNQKQAIESVLSDTDWFELDLFDNTIRKGNFGEMVTDTDLYGKGYTPLHNRVTDIDQSLSQGIDGVFQNPETGEYIIVETKFGQSNLNQNTASGPQMSSDWIEDRIFDEIGEDLGQDVLNEGYSSVLAKVSQNGHVQYFELNSAGQIIGEWTP